MSKSARPPNVGSGNSVPCEYANTRFLLQNLETVRKRMDSLQSFLAESIKNNIIISKDQMDAVSSEISAAIQQVIVNGAALHSSQQYPPPPHPQRQPVPDPSYVLCNRNLSEKSGAVEFLSDDCDVVELDAVELLAEFVHFCKICGKGFKRDANLRMHMRAHGDHYKTPEALSKPPPPLQLQGGAFQNLTAGNQKTLFSCPYEGCNRNRRNNRFRPLKSVICVRNHFRRNHCPKLYACHRCQKKSFSVLTDLKSHLKHCGEATTFVSTSSAPPRWRCSCGTSFIRKDKLFGHLARFEGHMPAVAEGSRAMDGVGAEEGEDAGEAVTGWGWTDDGFFAGLLDGFSTAENYSLQGILDSS